MGFLESNELNLLRLAGPLLLSAVTVVMVDLRMERRGFLPPRFRRIGDIGDVGAALRRSLAGVVLAGVFYVAVFSPLSLLGRAPDLDLANVGVAQLFLVHAILVAVLWIWYWLGFLPRRGDAAGWWDQFGLRATRIGREIALGAAAGAGIWLVVILLLVFLSALIVLLGGADALPQSPPPVVLWMAGLPVAIRLLVAISAGVFEEVFFRGFLQPRVGVGLSAGLFTLAHLSYQQPLMLVGVAVLSVCFAALVQWRQSIWAAIAAHAVFDLVQLLIVLPLGAKALAA